MRSYEARLQRVLMYIHDHPAQDLSLDTLAEIACMSRFHFHRVFRAMTGATVADLTRHLRLLAAANALLRDNAPLQDVARRHGYPNAASFSRAFRGAHGIAPGAFRRRGQALSNQLRTARPGDSMYPVSIEHLEPCRAAGIEHAGSYADMGRAFQAPAALLAARSLFPHVLGMFAIYHDAPGSRPEAELRAHAGVLVADDFPRDIRGVHYFDLAGGKHAVLRHIGPPATLTSAYEWLYGTWLPHSGEEPRDEAPIELYANDARTTPSDQIRTDIRLPLV